MKYYLNPKNKPTNDPILKKQYWKTAFSMQKIDNLTPSNYVKHLAAKHIRNETTYEEIHKNINKYYKTEKSKHEKPRTEEADKVSIRIAELLDKGIEKFELTPNMLNKIHGYLFQDVQDIELKPGKYRDVWLSKNEDVLNDKSVVYEPPQSISNALNYDFQIEQSKNYNKMTEKEKIENIQKFISGIWQIHPFREGNTRTTAMFTIMYMREKGFDIDNEPFQKQAKEFRNALALCQAPESYPEQTSEPLTQFFSKLIANIPEQKDVTTHKNIETSKEYINPYWQFYQDPKPDKINKKDYNDLEL